MVILIINKPGLTISIPGLKVVRSPVEIDVSRVNVNLVLTYLKSEGISDYHLISNKDIDTRLYQKYTWKNLSKKEQNIKESINDSNVNTILERFMSSTSQSKEVTVNTKDLEEQLSIFTKTIEKFIKQIPSTITIAGGQTQVKDEVPDEEKFIPEIKNGEMSIRGSNIAKVVEDNDPQDISDIVNILRQV